jgi:hypothetical protein
MKMNVLAIATGLADEALLERMRVLSQESRDVTVELIAHLVEVARRGLHRGEGPGKLFGYLTEVLRFSGAAAWNRIQAARAVRRFPVVLDLLADGSVNLTTVRILVPHLTKANDREVLAEAKGKSTRDVKAIAGRLAPRPDVPSSVRKLPAPRPASVVAATGHDRDEAPAAPSPAGPVRTSATPSGPAESVKPESHRPVVEPLAPARYRMQITLDEEMHDDLECLQGLMRREIPDGDPAEIVRQGLKMLRADRQKKAFAATARPRTFKAGAPESRHVEAEVRRQVWRRDGGRCAFIGRDGRRCTERSHLEFHHLRAYALGGGKTADNISLRCRAHNAYEAERVFDRIREDREKHVPACFETNRRPTDYA